jgi:hypothetical protein
MGRIVVVAARARVHGGDEHKVARIITRCESSRYGDMPVLERLPQDFERLTRKLREFVEK